MRTQNRPSSIRAVGVSLLGLALIGLAACGSDAPPTQQSLAPSTPTYPTPDSVVVAFNAIQTSPRLDVRGYYELIHAETEAQKRLLSTKDSMAIVHDLEAALKSRFSATLIPDDPRAFAHELLVPATITKSDADRAEASFVDEDGDSRILYLVRVGDRWWISGYTEEGAPGRKSKTAEGWDLYVQIVQCMADGCAGFDKRVASGEFATIEAYHSAIGATFKELAAQADARGDAEMAGLYTRYGRDLTGMPR